MEDGKQQAQSGEGQSAEMMNGAAPAERPRLDPEVIAKLAEVRGRIQSSVGQLVLAMMNLPRYRHQTLADLTHVILDPLMRDRIAIASGKGDDQSGVLAGIAIWAGVSEAVDAKIAEQVRAGVFPVRLGDEDWASGETLWLLDVIAPNRRLATSVLANFRQIAGDRPVKIHPIVARSVDPELLDRMRVKPDAAQAQAAEAAPVEG
jgi:cytolysin-activating lysine-acyltransferase